MDTNANISIIYWPEWVSEYLIDFISSHYCEEFWEVPYWVTIPNILKPSDHIIHVLMCHVCTLKHVFKYI